jgi:acetyl esterase/lipase
MTAKKAMTSQLGGKIDGVLEKDHEVRTPDGTKIVCRTYEPETKGSGTPRLLVVFHRGACCTGGLEKKELLCRLVTTTHRMVCVNVDYRLPPEHKFPARIYDCLNATQRGRSPKDRAQEVRKMLISIIRLLQTRSDSSLT